MEACALCGERNDLSRLEEITLCDICLETREGQSLLGKARDILEARSVTLQTVPPATMKNPTWPIWIIVGVFWVGALGTLIQNVQLAQYLEYSPGPVVMRWISSVIGFLFGLWIMSGLKSGRNGYRIFTLVVSILSLAGLAFLLVQIFQMPAYYRESDEIAILMAIGFAGVAYNLFMLWALLLHRATREFFSPTSKVPASDEKPATTVASPVIEGQEQDVDHALIERLKAKLK